MGYLLTFEEFKAALERDELLGLKCRDCGACTTPPKMLCVECGGSDLEVVQLSKKGTIKTFTVIRVAPQGFDPPLIVAMVELAEGPWVMGNVVNVDPEHVDSSLMGKAVRVGCRRIPQDPFSAGERMALTFDVC